MNSPGVLIRPEDSADRDEVFEVNAAAFETEAEAKLVDLLRDVAEPLVSLVAVVDGRLVGQILFTPVTVDQAPEGVLVMGLAPMAVRPEDQRSGIGSKLVRAGVRECAALGATAVVVMGHETYYPRFGFEPAAPHGLRYRNEELDPYFMVLELRRGTLQSLSGHVHYHPAFEGM